MGKREENLKRLESLGIMISEGQVAVAEPPDRAEAAGQTEVQVERAAVEAKVETPHPQQVPDRSPDGHNWDKRKADAQAAQRQLQEERIAAQREREALAAERAAIEEARKAMAVKDSLKEDEPDDLDLEYPDLAKSMDRRLDRKLEKARKADQERIEKLQSALDELQNKYLKEQAQKATKSVLEQILERHPDAEDVCASDAFEAWVDSHPPRIAAEYRETIVNAGSYDAEDTNWILDQYKATLPAKQPKRHESPVEPSPAPVFTPMGDGGKATSVASPLSLDEIASFGRLMREARTQKDRDVLKARLAITTSSNNR